MDQPELYCETLAARWAGAVGVWSSVVEGTNGRKALSWHCPAPKEDAGSAGEDGIVGIPISQLAGTAAI